MEKEKKLQIIRTAAKRFDKHGLSKTTLDEVARDLRIGKATIYHYFESKDELYYAVLDWEGNLLLEEIKNILIKHETSATQRLNEYLSVKENLQQKYKLIYDTLLHILVDSSLEPDVKFFVNFTAKEEELLLQFINTLGKNKSEDVKATIHFIISQGWNFFFSSKLNPAAGEDKSSIYKEYLIKILDGKLA